jgi:hypothetical protein
MRELLGLALFVLFACACSDARTSSVEISRPTAASIASLSIVAGDVTVLSFVEEGDLRDQVYGYLQDLAKQGGKPIVVTELDWMVDVALATEHKISRDAVVVMANGKSERVHIWPLPSRRGTRVEVFDRDIASALVKVRRPELVAEIIETGTTTPTPQPHRTLEQALVTVGYRLAKPDAPGGAPQLLVLVDGGARPIDDVLQRIDAHVAAGGSALIALEPVAGTTLGPLEARLGLRFDPTALADDQTFVRARKTDADHGNIATDAFASHAATAAASRTSGKGAAVFLSAGSLEAVAGAPQRPVFLVHSRSSTFRDRDANFRFDPGETRALHEIAAAVELALPARSTSAPSAKPGRVLIYADADWLGDAVVMQVQLHTHLLLDGLRWLGRESELPAPKQVAGAVDPVGAPVAMTRYPLRPRTATRPGTVREPLWNEGADRITGITLTRPDRTVSLTRRADQLWGREERKAAPAREFPVEDDVGRKLLQGLARPPSLRALGKLAAERRGGLGLDRPDRLVVTFGGKSRELAIGGNVYGGSDLYVEDLSTGEAHVITGSLVAALNGGEATLRIKSLLPFKDVTSVTVEVGQIKRELPAGDLVNAPAGTPEALGALIIQHVHRINPIAYPSDADAGTPTTIARLSVAGKGGATMDIELLRTPDAFYVRTRRTGLARVANVAGQALLSRIEEVAAMSPSR